MTDHSTAPLLETGEVHPLGALHVSQRGDGTWEVLTRTGACFARTQHLANARLIAAAPELLDALNCLLADTSHAPLPIELARAFGPSWDVSLDALAKAEGHLG